MRPRKEIETAAKKGQPLEPLILEVVLDIRDKVRRLSRQPSNAGE
jgi:hypothetical protein